VLRAQFRAGTERRRTEEAPRPLDVVGRARL